MAHYSACTTQNVWFYADILGFGGNSRHQGNVLGVWGLNCLVDENF